MDTCIQKDTHTEAITLNLTTLHADLIGVDAILMNKCNKIILCIQIIRQIR